jgi:hypothetical protein
MTIIEGLMETHDATLSNLRSRLTKLQVISVSHQYFFSEKRREENISVFLFVRKKNVRDWKYFVINIAYWLVIVNLYL